MEGTTLIGKRTGIFAAFELATGWERKALYKQIETRSFNLVGCCGFWGMGSWIWGQSLSFKI